MNLYFIAAGVGALSVLAGHNTVGARMFFDPVRKADIDPYAKRVLSFVWHTVDVTVFLMLTVALAIGLGFEDAGTSAGWLVTATFALWGLLHLGLALTSGLARAPAKLFQWAIFLAIAALSGLGNLA